MQETRCRMCLTVPVFMDGVCYTCYIKYYNKK